MKENLSAADVHSKVKRKYTEISCSVKDRFKYPTGMEAAVALGYDQHMLDQSPHCAVDAFCGVGNPFSLGPVRRGDHVIDIGCGAGLDLIIAGCLSGEDGHCTGIDLVPAIIDRAGSNLETSGLSSLTVEQAGSEELPFDNGTFDLVLSNGALYLSPLKQKTFEEAFRVLRPGGRLQIADVVMKENIPEKVRALFEGWSG